MPPLTCTSRKSFTLVELITSIAIIGILVAVIIPAAVNYVATSREAANRHNLAILNDALNRYKTQGGNLNALTSGIPAPHLISALQTPVSWNGFTHQFLRTSFTLPEGNTLAAAGSGQTFRLTQYGSYSAESGSELPSGGPTVVSDNFDSYANSANLGSQPNWADVRGNMVVLNGTGTQGSIRANNGVGVCGTRYTGATFSANQYAEATLDTITGYGGGVAVRCQSGAASFYYTYYRGGSTLLYYGRVINGTQWWSSGLGVTLVTGDKLRMEVTGTGAATRLTVKTYSGGVWTNRWTDIDPGAGYYLDGGNPGVAGYSTNGTTLTSWTAGDL